MDPLHAGVDPLRAARQAEEACDLVGALDALDAATLAAPRSGEVFARRAALVRAEPIGLRLETSWQDDVARAAALDPALGLQAAKARRVAPDRLDLSGVEVKDGTLARRVGPHLRLLDISGAEVSDRGLSSLEAAPALRSLSLSYTNVRGPGLAVLAALPALRSLRLRGLALLLGVREPLGRATALVDLDLSWASAAVVALVGAPRSLEGLGLAGCDLAGEVVPTLLSGQERLVRLNLAGAQGCGDALARAAAGLPRLRFLSLAGTSVTAAGLAALAAGAPALETLDLRGVSLAAPDVVDALVALAPRLRALDLGAAPPTKPGARHPAPPPPSTPGADDDAMARITAAAAKLITLRLSFRALTDRGLVSLSPTLASLDVRGTGVTSVAAPSLREVDVTGTTARASATWTRRDAGWTLQPAS